LPIAASQLMELSKRRRGRQVHRGADELVVRRHQHVDVPQIVGRRYRPDHLQAVDEHDRPGCTGQAADRGDIEPVAGRRLHAAESTTDLAFERAVEEG
jgi:hypothetical protein